MPMTEAGRRAVSLAQKKRWAKHRKINRRLNDANTRKPYKVRVEVMKAYQTLGRYIKRQSL